LALGGELAAIRNDIRHCRVVGLSRNRSQRNEGREGRSANKRGRYCCPNGKSSTVHDILTSDLCKAWLLPEPHSSSTPRSVDDASTARYANPDHELPRELQMRASHRPDLATGGQPDSLYPTSAAYRLALRAVIGSSLESVNLEAVCGEGGTPSQNAPTTPSREPACLGKNTRPRDRIGDITLLAVYLIGDVGPRPTAIRWCRGLVRSSYGTS
jgi:hypothetical protein